MKGVEACALHRGSESIPGAFQLDEHGVDLLEVRYQVRPRDRDFSLVEAPPKIDFESECEEARDDVTDGGVVPVVIDGPHFKGGFLLPEGPFHSPETLIRCCHLCGGHVRVRGKHKLAVHACVSVNGILVDGDAPLGDTHEAGVSSIADDRFRTLLGERLLELRQDCFSCGLVFRRFDGVATDEVASLAHKDFFHFQVVGHLLVPPRPREDLCAYLLLFAHATAENVGKRGVLIFGEELDGVGRDHPAISHENHIVYLQSFAQPAHHHLQRTAVGRVAGEDVPRHRPAVPIHDDAQDELRQIRPPVPRVSSFEKIRLRVCVHVEAGGVDEDQIELKAEQIPITPRQLSFQLVAQFREEGGGAVEVLERQRLESGSFNGGDPLGRLEV